LIGDLGHETSTQLTLVNKQKNNKIIHHRDQKNLKRIRRCETDYQNSHSELSVSLMKPERDSKGQECAMTGFHDREVRRHSQIYSATVFERLDRVKTSHSMRRSRRAVRNAG